MKTDTLEDRAISIARKFAADVDIGNWAFSPIGGSFDHDLSISFCFEGDWRDPFFGGKINMLTGEVEEVDLFFRDKDEVKNRPKTTMRDELIKLEGFYVSSKERPEVREIFEMLRRRIKETEPASE